MKNYDGNIEEMVKDFSLIITDLDEESDKTCSLRCNECMFKTRNNCCSVNELYNIHTQLYEKVGNK